MNNKTCFFIRSDRRGMLDASHIQALAGESVLEKERQLSEMILQLQMVRDQLLAQQEHAKVSDSHDPRIWCDDGTGMTRHPGSGCAAIR